jgi:hypothetical protein
MHVWVKPKLHIHIECGQRFLSLLHTPCTVDCLTVLECVLLNDINLALAPRQGPKISSWARLGVLARTRYHTQCWLTDKRIILLRVSCLETPKAGSGSTNFRAEPSLASLLAISLPCTPELSRDPVQPHRMTGRDIIQCLLALGPMESFRGLDTKGASQS